MDLATLRPALTEANQEVISWASRIGTLAGVVRVAAQVLGSGPRAGGGSRYGPVCVTYGALQPSDRPHIYVAIFQRSLAGSWRRASPGPHV